ncbi:cytochrome P450 [Nocardia sp. NPDC055049]
MTTNNPKGDAMPSPVGCPYQRKTAPADLVQSTSTSDVAPVPTVDIDPYAEEFFRDPYPWHEQMREAGPVFTIDRWNLFGVARHADVRAVLADPDSFCSGDGVGPTNYSKDGPPRPPIMVLEDDGDEHSRLRAIYNRVLSRRSVAALREHFTDVAEKMVDQVLEMRSFDAVPELSEAYPLSVFPDAIGLKKEGRDRLLPFADLAFNTHGPANDRRRESIEKMQEYLPFQIQSCQRENIADDSIGATIFAYADEGKISHADAVALMSPLFTAGMDTTVNTLSAALYCLAVNPDQWQRLREDPSLSRSAFEEAVRYETPIQSFCRTTTRPVEIGGTPIGAGEKVMMFFAAANRDPRRWEQPDSYDLSRDLSGHVGFGAGVHMCAGQLIAKLEGEILLGAFARKVRSIEITGPVTRRYNNVMRGIRSMPITILPK